MRPAHVHLAIASSPSHRYMFDGLCIPASDCPSGTRASGTGFFYRVCAELEACAEGSYEAAPPVAGDDSRKCHPLTTCAEDEAEVVAPTTSSDRLCLPFGEACGQGTGLFVDNRVLCTFEG